MPRVRYEWDDGKDINRLQEIDTRFEHGEERIQIIGVARGDVLFVIATLREEDICRIISVGPKGHTT